MSKKKMIDTSKLKVEVVESIPQYKRSGRDKYGFLLEKLDGLPPHQMVKVTTEVFTTANSIVNTLRNYITKNELKIGVTIRGREIYLWNKE